MHTWLSNTSVCTLYNRITLVKSSVCKYSLLQIMSRGTVIFLCVKNEKTTRSTFSRPNSEEAPGAAIQFYCILQSRVLTFKTYLLTYCECNVILHKSHRWLRWCKIIWCTEPKAIACIIWYWAEPAEYAPPQHWNKILINTKIIWMMIKVSTLFCQPHCSDSFMVLNCSFILQYQVNVPAQEKCQRQS